MKAKGPRFKQHFLVLLFALLLPAVEALAKDDWLQVKSKNFLLIGNASEKDIRKVGTRLEQFRETFRQLFAKTNLTASIPTNVIIFKSSSAYTPFKPVRANGTTDNSVTGFFQAGQDVNYITISIEGEDQRTYQTIFHEYVHFVLNTNFGKSEIPPWFNEGMAEFYETFQIEDDQRVKLGLPQTHHLTLLRQNKFIPLEDLFKVTSYQLLQTGDHSRSIFYAESWALIHYLTINGKTDELTRFLDLTIKKVPQERAFQEAFQMSYVDMEGILRIYIQQGRYQYEQIALEKKLTYDAAMVATPIDDADSNAYLGDLLYHTNRPEDAEPYLAAALKIRPELGIANTSLGMIRLRQKNYDEARKYLEKAIASDQKNYLAYYDYAYLLSRDGRDELGNARAFSSETTSRIRNALNKAISLKPEFAPSYERQAYVNLVNNEQLDESVALLQKALQYQPGNQECTIRLGEVYLRMKKYSDAEAVAKKLVDTADDADRKSRAEDLNNQIHRMRQLEAEKDAQQKRDEAAAANAGSGPSESIRGDGRRASDEELTREAKTEGLRSINRALRKPDRSENRVIGYLQNIDCKAGIVFKVKTDSETFALATKSFDTVALNSFVPLPPNSSVGCEVDMSAVKAVITFVERASQTGNVRGDIVSVEFVPVDFHIMSADELNKSIAIEPSIQLQDKEERAAIMRAIREALSQPGAGEKRELGYLEKIDCASGGRYFQMRTATEVLRLFNSSSAAVEIRLFTRELEGKQFGCTMSPINVPAVFIYKENTDTRKGSAGEIVSIEFVPRSFTLN